MNQFIVNSKTLFSALDFARKVISTQTVLPILENFFMRVKDGTLSVRGSDIQTTITASVQVEVYQSANTQFEFLLPTGAHVYLKLLDEQPITVRFNPDTPEKIEILSDEGVAKFTSDNPKDYIADPAKDTPSHCFPLPHEALTELSDLLVYASHDELRPAMTGINFSYHNGKLELAATDGHTLKTKTIPEIKIKSKKPEAIFILPRRAAGILAQVKGNKGLSVDIDAHKMNVFFTGTHNGGLEIEIHSRTINERYPDVHMVIPKDDLIKSRFVGERKKMISLLERTKPFRNKTTHQVELRFAKGGSKLFCEDMNFGFEYLVDLPGALSGDDIRIGFNANFLLRALQSFKGDDYTLEMQAPNKCGVLKDETSIALFMPVMINQFVHP